ncbi:MAG: hypothetical protein M0Q23_07905 [Syntrophales bacterium]|jgi:aldehyde:ferredoxin oxidoreductase|nr:hypothetical protein [Syntrophales bacterium]MCK9528548.1 hypothetical protein [Syntrophales bacterium]MDX9922825.1 aldehyde ferredoxin oxidoreductase C-terminal domain-containing protein [Syntrophales bacterium]
MATPNGGYFGKVLEIDLTKQTSKVRPLSDETARKFMGGCGLGAYYIASEYKAGKDPLAEDAFIFIGTGPLNGTFCVATRTSFVNINPHNGLLSHAEVGAHFGNEIKWAGWDGIYITGRSAQPVWLYIQDDKVQFRDASKIWGKDTYETEETMKHDVCNPYARTAVIGPAGENGVPYSCVIIERFRAAARTGTGMVMGNKKLKGIAMSGTKAVPVVDNAKFLPAAVAVKQFATQREAWQGIKRWGSAGLLELKHWVDGSLITKNFQTTWWPDIYNIGGEEANRTFWKRHAACNNCPVHCMKYGVIREEGKYYGLVAEGPEYETGGLLGSNLGMREFAPMMGLIEAADAYGLDAISLGGVLAFTTECVEKGVLKAADLDGINVKWGDGDAYMELIKKITKQEGRAGKLLAKGVAGMSREIGKGSEAWAVVTKGKEFAAHDPRGDKSRGYSYAMGTCGGDHHEGTSPGGLGLMAMFNSLVMCSFVGLTHGAEIPASHVAMLNPLCGWNMTDDEYWAISKRIMTIERCIQVREGISSKDDMLPARLRKEPLPEGPKKGAVWTDEDTRKMHDSVYAHFGWDDKGVPTEKALKNYGLDFMIDDVKEARKKYTL